MNRSLTHNELIRCDGNCNQREHHAHTMTKFNGYMLCPDCLIIFNESKEEAIQEEVFQEQLDNLPADQLQTIKWMFDVFEGVHSEAMKTHENCRLWKARVECAIDNKKKCSTGNV